MPIELENSPAVPGGLSRRSLLKGAAWSLPVVAVAAAAPRAVASGEPGTLTLSFAVLVAELTWEDVFAGYVSITNLSGSDIVGESATLVLSGFPGGETPAATVEYPTGDLLLDDGDQPPRAVRNSALPLLSDTDGSLVLFAESLSLAVDETLVIGFFLRRPAFNAVQKIFFIAGRLEIGDRVAEISGNQRLRVDLPDQ